MRRGLDRSHASGLEAGRRRESLRDHRHRRRRLGRRHALDLSRRLDALDELQDRAGRLGADATQRPDGRALQRRQPLDDRDAIPVRSVHELARGRSRLDGDRHAARSTGRIRTRNPPRPEVARRALLLHLHQVPPDRRVDLPDLRLRREVEPHRHTNDSDRPLHRHKPTAGDLDDALLLRRGAAGADRGFRDRRHQPLQPAALGNPADRRTRYRRHGTALRDLRVERVLLRHPAELRQRIDDGELRVLVGPSGSGKSTALRMLAGLEPLDEGRILIGGKDVSSVRPRDRDIAMVFQNYALYPNLDVAANMGFALKQQGVPKHERLERVRETAKLLDLEPYLDRKPRNLSGGQRQRVAMGRAIVRHPQVYLMDEPLSNLDAKLRVQTRTELVELQTRLAVTTVYVTHDQVEAMTMGHRVAVLRDGDLQQCDTPATLYHAPSNLFVAGFIGSPAMNTLS